MTKILVAEDERDIRELVIDTLFDKGYDVLESKDGRETLQTANKEIPDLILLDVMMPGMDGFEVLKRLRENPLTGDIPVVMLTSMGAPEGEQHAMRLGVQHYVSKSFDPETLQATGRVALREAGAKLDRGDDIGKVWGSSTQFHSAAGKSRPPGTIPLGTQLGALEK